METTVSSMEKEEHSRLPRTLTDAAKLRHFACAVGILAISLIAAVGIILALSTIVGVTNFTFVHRHDNTPNQGNDSGGWSSGETCLTGGCVDLASAVRHTLNSSAAPCDDFYEYACGGWEKKTDIPSGLQAFDVRYQVQSSNTIALKKILDRGRDDGLEAVKKVVDFYQSCLNLSYVESLGAQPLLDLINQTGGWSVLSQNEAKSEWNLNSRGFIQERLLGSDAFFKMDIQPDLKESPVYLLSIHPSGLTLEHPDAYQDSEQLQSLKSEMIAALSLLIDNSTIAEQVAGRIVSFETSLSEIFEHGPHHHGHHMKIRDLYRKWPYLVWESFFKLLFDKANMTVSGNEVISVRTPPYFDNLGFLLKRTPSNVLEDYSKWHLIRNYLQYIRESSNETSTWPSCDSTSEEGSQYTFCVELTESFFPLVMARLFADNLLSTHAKSNVYGIVRDVKKAFRERIRTSAWLDENTKKQAMDKLKAVSSFQGYPDEIFNDTTLNLLYAECEVSSEDFFGNCMRSVVCSRKAVLRRLHHIVNKEAFVWSEFQPSRIDVHFSPPVDSIVIFEGLLQAPWFSTDWPEYFKYGAIGAVIGHELAIALDKIGVERQAYRRDCFVRQYSDYKMYGIEVDGKRSLPSNIADNAGLSVAFQAYKKRSEQDKLLPSLPDKADQLFFIAWAQLWCSLYTDDGFTAAANAPHAPGPFRVIGSVVNSAEFAETFSCSAGTPMNPKDKCTFW